MINVLGWIATLFILVGYWSNASQKKSVAFTAWIVGDVLWIAYDVLIANWSHLVLSVVIITLNVYGMFLILKNRQNDISI